MTRSHRAGGTGPDGLYAQFLDMLFGRDMEGFVALALGIEGVATGGTYKFPGGFSELYYSWPHERTRLLEYVARIVADEQPVDVYICPALRDNRSRRGDRGQGNSNATRLQFLWADLDEEPVGDRAHLLETLDGCIVRSGTPGHRHVYVPLTEPVDVRTHRRLNGTLAKRLGADSKWTDESLLRLPGTCNYKTDPPSQVTVEQWSSRTWPASELADLLGPCSDDEKRAAPGANEPSIERETLPDPLPLSVRDALDAPLPHGDDRSAGHHRLVRTSRCARLTLGQTAAVVDQYPPSREKYGPRLDDEIVRSWVSGSKNDEDDDEVAEAGRPLPNLPGDFWEARPCLSHIRAAAHARGAASDVVLHVVLARLSSQLDHRLRVDTGVLSPASLNFFSAVVGPSGTGKSAGVRVARDLLPSSYLAPEDYLDERPLGSGEGLAELYMGTVEEPVEGDDASATRRQGKPRKVRQQVRHNALVFSDEGESLVKMMHQRSGSTLGPTIRSAWIGDALGQSNASSETTRVVPRGSYSLGFVVAFQPETIEPFLADAGGGTPQRFLYCSASDPSLPDEAPPWPGPLTPTLTVGHEGFEVLPIEVIDESVRVAVRADHLARARGEKKLSEPLDAHAPLQLAKTAALLAILDGRMDGVLAEDWALAKVILDTSTRVRSELVRCGRERVRRDEQYRTSSHVQREEQAEAARLRVPHRVGTIARSLAARVRTDGPMTRGALRKLVRGNDRAEFFDPAFDKALDEQWLAEIDGRIEAGPVVPN